jgi:hypothetical protein
MKTRRTHKELREAYAAIMKRSEQTPEAFNAAVTQLLTKKGWKKTPGNYVKGAERVTFPCRRCAGTGQFITRVENGKPCGPGGQCFRCQGKGFQDDKDRRRNYGYDNYAIAKNFREMMAG